MTTSAVNLRSVRLDQRRVAALLGASRQVPVPSFNYPKVTIDNLFKSRFYRELEKRGDQDVSESHNSLEVQSKHLQSYFNLRKHVEKSVSKKIEAIRNRAEDTEAYLEEEEGRRRETRNKRKKRKVVLDKDEKETWRKLKGRRNSKTSLDEVLESNSSKKWTWNLSELKVGPNVSSRPQLSKTYHDNSTELQLSSEGQNKHFHESTPFRLPKLQIPVGREKERGTFINHKQLEAEPLPPLPSSSLPPSRRNKTLPVLIEPLAPNGDDFSRRESPVVGKNIKTSHSSESERISTKQSNTGRRKTTKVKSSPESYQNGNSQETRPKSIEGKTDSDDFMADATEEGFLKVSELSLRTESEVVHHDNSDEYEGMSTEDDYADRLQSQEFSRSPTIRKKIPSKMKWDPNSHSEIMRRKLNTLMRKRRLARLDRIRLGQLDETDQAIDTLNYADSERTVQVMYESAPEFGKSGNIIKHTKTKKQGGRKGRVTSKTTSRAFSYSYFALSATGK